MSARWQQQAVAFAEQRNLRHPAGVHVLDLVSEVGEVAKEILLATEYGRRPLRPRPELAAELGDVLYGLCLVADAAGVDLESALAAALDKYERRWAEKGHAGSQE